MSPSPADITDAIMLLQSLPGTRGTDTLDQIEFANSPRGRMARTLISWINNPNIDLATFTAKDMADTLNKFAATQGLYITTDPGELIQYRLARQAANGHVLHDASVSYAPDQGGLNAAREDCAKYADPEGCCPRIAALYLLPEGGKQ